MKKKVLYIDDKDFLLRSVSRLLSRYFSDVAECRTASSGDSGVDIVRAGFVPDLVLLDLHSSGGTVQGSLRTLAQLRELAPDAMVVAYTDHQDYSTEALLEMGFDAHCDIKGVKMDPDALKAWFQTQLG